MAGIGQIWTFAEGSVNVRLQIRKATFEPIAAPENETFVGCVDLSISKQKQLVGADFGFS
jgi:hypothetical protein